MTRFAGAWSYQSRREASVVAVDVLVQLAAVVWSSSAVGLAGVLFVVGFVCWVLLVSWVSVWLIITLSLISGTVIVGFTWCPVVSIGGPVEFALWDRCWACWVFRGCCKSVGRQVV